MDSTSDNLTLSCWLGSLTSSSRAFRLLEKAEAHSGTWHRWTELLCSLESEESPEELLPLDLEKELTYYGHLPPGRVVDQWVTKFPRLQKAWKTVYLVKYGLDQGMYTAFQRLIKNTAVGSSARHAVEMLLIEWR